MPRKNMNQPYYIYVLSNFFTADRSYTTKYLKKTLIEVGSSHIYASFGTFFVQIGQLFRAKQVFDKCMKTVKSLFSKENDFDFDFEFEFFRNLTVPRLIDKFEPKRCQKKHKDVSYKLQ